MDVHKTLIITHRGVWQQQNLVSAAPKSLDITVKREVTRQEMLDILPEVEFLISEREDVIDAEMIAAAKRLKLIQRLGSQYWDIDTAAAEKAGILVCYWPDQSTINVAEHCLMMSLDLLKKARDCMAVMNDAAWTREPRRSDEDTFAYNWTGRQGVGTLRGITAGILGFGEIGRELAQRLKGFETRILYHKRRRMPTQAEEQLGITYSDPQTIVREADILYGLLPYSTEGDQSMDSAFFESMKPGSYFVFCGGSGLVDEGALLGALRRGHLAGAGLDTYTWEPLPTDSPLLEAHRDLSINLILTPHTAAGTDGGGREKDYTNLIRFLEGRPVLYRLV